LAKFQISKFKWQLKSKCPNAKAIPPCHCRSGLQVAFEFCHLILCGIWDSPVESALTGFDNVTRKTLDKVEGQYGTLSFRHVYTITPTLQRMQMKFRQVISEILTGGWSGDILDESPRLGSFKMSKVERNSENFGLYSKINRILT
jgi:hypothetical protein